MFDFNILLEEAGELNSGIERPGRRQSAVFRCLKFGVDVIVCLALMPVLLIVGVILLIVNPKLNPGPLFFRQHRMGKGCKSFTAIKFRSMLCSDDNFRLSSDPVEKDRITPFGNILRRSRVDELPQILNVLKGEMSLIGPRPDCMPHAQEFINSVSGYRERHSVRPGISGLAQTEIGYTIGASETQRKVAADLHYIRRAGYRMEMWIFWRTVQTVLGLQGR